MCCRLNHSHRFVGIIAGLYIFLATFLIGFFMVKLASRVLWLDISGPESLALLSNVESPKQLDTCTNEDGIFLLRWYEKPADGRTLIPVIGVSKGGLKPVEYFEGNFLVNGRPAELVLAELTPPGDNSSTSLEAVSVPPHKFSKELKPGHTEMFFVPRDVGESYTVTFYYRKAPSPYFRTLSAHFSGNNQLPDGCAAVPEQYVQY